MVIDILQDMLTRAAAAAIDGVKEGETRPFEVKDYKRSPKLPFSAVDNVKRILLLKEGTARPVPSSQAKRQRSRRQPLIRH